MFSRKFLTTVLHLSSFLHFLTLLAAKKDIFTILGLYNIYQIGQLKGAVAAQSTAIADLFHKLKAQKSVLHQH